MPTTDAAGLNALAMPSWSCCCCPCGHVPVCAGAEQSCCSVRGLFNVDELMLKASEACLKPHLMFAARFCVARTTPLLLLFLLAVQRPSPLLHRSGRLFRVAAYSDTILELYPSWRCLQMQTTFSDFFCKQSALNFGARSETKHRSLNTSFLLHVPTREVTLPTRTQNCYSQLLYSTKKVTSLRCVEV